MENNIFKLTDEHSKKIGLDLQAKIQEGLKESGKEIACLPTYINPGEELKEKVKNFVGKILVLDWGGTNFRAAIVSLKKGEKPVVVETLKKTLSAKELEGFKGEDLHREMASLIVQLKELDNTVTHIGYCFSYEAESTLDGDAILLRWAKGMNISDMLNKLVGRPLVDYLNKYEGIKGKTEFKTVKVINDTIACLFAGLEQPGYDSYIGLIVGTGNNMAAVIPAKQIQKLDKNYKGGEFIPVNLESGNLRMYSERPDGYLTEIDKKVDLCFPPEQEQLFEKAMSGRYVGAIFSNYFSGMEIDPEFDGKSLTDMLNYPAIYKDECVTVAREIYVRSAQLTAASLAGLTLVLVSYKNEKDFDKSISSVCLAADGSLFWSKDKNGLDYSELVKKYLKIYLQSYGLGDIHFHFSKLEDPNLIGSAIAALS